MSAVVTGGASGLGLATEFQGQARYVHADLCDAAQMAAVFDAAPGIWRSG